MKSARKRLLTGFVCLLMAFSLTGCALFDAVSPESEIGYAALPKPEGAAAAAPIGDEHEKTVYGASLYYPDAEGEVSFPYTRVLWLDGDTPLNRRLCEELMKNPGNDVQSAAPKGSRVLFAESGSGLVNVCIQPAAALDEDQVITLAAALSKTLLNIPENTGVSLMLSERAAGVNLLPLGVIDRDTDLSVYRNEALSEGAAIERNILAYYPADDGEHLIAESVPVILHSDDSALSVISALAAAPQNACALSVSLNPENAFEKPSAYSVTTDGERVLNLYFTESGFEALSKGGHTLNQALASVTLTLTTFLPGTDGVVVHTPSGKVTQIAKTQGTLRFENGILKRKDFSGLIGESVKVYFAGENDMLVAETRVLPQEEALSVRRRLAMLFEGPCSDKLTRTMPAGAAIQDILGIRISERIAHVNLSGELYGKCQSFSRAQEEMFVYSVVNTLCEIEGVSGVCLYVEGQQADVLTQFIHLEGVLMKNPGRVSNEQ